MSTITDLSVSDLARWAGQQAWSQFALSIAQQFNTKGVMSPKQEQALRSMYAKSLARQADKANKPVNTDPVTEVGMYSLSQAVYRVKLSKAGRLYAMQFIPSAPTKSERFEYAPGVIHDLQATDRLTVEQVSKMGLQFGVCCVCGAELSDADSVARGIGPVCIKKV